MLSLGTLNVALVDTQMTMMHSLWETLILISILFEI